MITEMTEEEQRRLIGDLARKLADTAADGVKDIARPLATLLAINGAINALGILVRLDPDPVGTAKAAAGDREASRVQHPSRERMMISDVLSEAREHILDYLGQPALADCYSDHRGEIAALLLAMDRMRLMEGLDTPPGCTPPTLPDDAMRYLEEELRKFKKGDLERRFRRDDLERRWVSAESAAKPISPRVNRRRHHRQDGGIGGDRFRVASAPAGVYVPNQPRFPFNVVAYPPR
jgi:hypothetical protein